MQAKTNDFPFTVWFCKLGQGETEETATSQDLLNEFLKIPSFSYFVQMEHRNPDC